MAQPLTRRSLVTSTPAAVLAAAVPPLSPPRHLGPDAELLSLAEDFERLHDQWQALDQVADRLQPLSDDQDASGARTPYDDAFDAAEDKLEQLDAVADRMRALPARTVQGIAVKARLAQFDAHLSYLSKMDGPEADWDWDVRCMARFVRELQHFAEAYTGGLDG